MWSLAESTSTSLFPLGASLSFRLSILSNRESRSDTSTSTRTHLLVGGLSLCVLCTRKKSSARGSFTVTSLVSLFCDPSRGHPWPVLLQRSLFSAVPDDQGVATRRSQIIPNRQFKLSPLALQTSDSLPAVSPQVLLGPTQGTEYDGMPSTPGHTKRILADVASTFRY